MSLTLKGRRTRRKTCCMEHCCDEEQQKEEPSTVEFVRNVLQRKLPLWRNVLMKKKKETISAVETLSVGEFVRAEHTEGSTAMETPSVEEFVKEEVTGEESTAVQTPSMVEGVNEENQVEGTSTIETPPPPPVEEFVNEKEKQHGEQKQKDLTRRILSFRKRKMKTLPFQLDPAYLLCIVSFFASYHGAITSTSKTKIFLYELSCVYICFAV